MKKKNPTPKKETYKYTYGYSVLKSSEGGQGVATLKSVFKKKQEGIKITFGYSPYIGHTAFTIHATTKARLQKAAKEVVSYGYCGSVKYIMQGADRI